MENTTDTLQSIIMEAKNDLSQETREAIDSVNWKLTILEMAGKYNQDQLDTLEIETELLLCGILSPDEYQKELENRMMLTGEQVNFLLEEMDKLIFKKIQDELEKKISSKKETSSMQKVESSKKDKVITDYQLPITNQEKTVNEKKVAEEDEVPKPPYAEVITNDQSIINTGEEKNSIDDDKLRIKNVDTSDKEQVVDRVDEGQKEKPVVPVSPATNVGTNLFEEKLKGPTVSEHTVSDYSKPKIDPYREAF